MLHIQKKDPALFQRHRIDHQGFLREAGIGFRKDLSGAHAIQEHMIAPQIVPLNGNAAGKNDSQLMHMRSGPVQYSAL